MSKKNKFSKCKPLGLIYLRLGLMAYVSSFIFLGVAATAGELPVSQVQTSGNQLVDKQKNNLQIALKVDKESVPVSAEAAHKALLDENRYPSAATCAASAPWPEKCGAHVCEASWSTSSGSAVRLPSGLRASCSAAAL